MKSHTKPFFMTSLGVMALIAAFAMTTVVGCGGDGKDTTANDVERDVNDALKTTGKYLAEKKDKFMKTASEQVDKLKEGFDELGRDISDQGDVAKQKYESFKRKFDQRMDEVRDELAELRDSGEEGWDDVKDGISDAVEELKKAFNEAAAEFKES